MLVVCGSNVDSAHSTVKSQGRRPIHTVRVTRPVPADLRVHPGRDWFTVLSGTIVLRLAERTILVRAGEAAEFSTTVPHAFGATDGPAEILCILDHDGERTHLGPDRY